MAISASNLIVQVRKGKDLAQIIAECKRAGLGKWDYIDVGAGFNGIYIKIIGMALVGFVTHGELKNLTAQVDAHYIALQSKGSNDENES